MKKTKLSLNPLAAAIAFMSGTIALPQIAVAQDEAREEEEVLVVSARRRDETLQEVPISLSSFSGDAMEKTGITDLVALGASAPNTTLKTSRATNNTLSAFIRGVGQQDPLVGFEAGVGIYIDDIYLNRPQGAVLDVYEVERVEILRGPQGTLYGRNTIGGAVKYVTKRLSDETTASVKASVGTYDQADLILAGSTPLADDTLRIGGAIASLHRDGFGENVLTGQDNYDKDSVAARATVEATPSDELFIRVVADYVYDTSNPRHGHSIVDGNTRDVFDTAAGVDDWLENGGSNLTDNFFEGFGVAASVEYEISDELTFKSITAYREDETNNKIDFTDAFAPFFDAPLIYENDQLSQEFQVTFNFERVQGLAGVYFLDSYAMNEFDVLLGSAAYTFAEVDTFSSAAFFDLSYDVSDTIALGFGLRYTQDKKDFNSFKASYTFGDNGVLLSPAFGGNGIIDANGDGIEDAPILDPVTGQEISPNFVADRTDDAVTPKLSISWQPVDEHHVYASYSQGYKGGGYDPRGNYALAVAQEGFEPETVDAYELGIKSTFLDGAISTNIAGFYSDYTDVQIPGSTLVDSDGDGVTDTFDGAVTNAGEATIHGVEIDVTANLTDNLTSKLALGLINAEYDEFVGRDDDGELINIADQRNFQNTPETTGSFSLIYSMDAGPGELTLNGTASYTSFTQQFEVPGPLDQPGYALFNLSAVWTSDDDKWQAGIHGRNLSDKEYRVAGYSFGAGIQTAFYGNPRTVTATVKYNLF
ncbi:MAG: TonB-dependent receptor [Agarilytica sp.]